MLEDIESMIDNVWSTSKGGGKIETITASILGVLLVLAVVLALFVPTNDKTLDFLFITITGITSFYFGGKTQQYKKEEEKK